MSQRGIDAFGLYPFTNSLNVSKSMQIDYLEKVIYDSKRVQQAFHQLFFYINCTEKEIFREITFAI